MAKKKVKSKAKNKKKAARPRKKVVAKKAGAKKTSARKAPKKQARKIVKKTIKISSHVSGYSKNLFILAFDHRGSFQKKLFGINGEPTADQTREIASYKRIIYDGFKKALELGVPKDTAGILIDEQFGAEILSDAKMNGITRACPAEKSGQDEFDFEYGEDFASHIQKFEPTFVKVLVRFNPESDPVLNRRQAARLKRLSEHCRKTKRHFIFELLVPAEPHQLQALGGNQAAFDSQMRPKLMVRSMKDLQDVGVEPDVWKLEGLENEADATAVAHQARAGGRSHVGVVVLGRGENDEKVRHWLQVAAQVPGFLGFAVGRTIFWDPLKGIRENRFSREQAVEQIARNYKSFYETWTRSKAH